VWRGSPRTMSSRPVSIERTARSSTIFCRLSREACGFIKCAANTVADGGTIACSSNLNPVGSCGSCHVPAHPSQLSPAPIFGAKKTRFVPQVKTVLGLLHVVISQRLCQKWPQQYYVFARCQRPAAMCTVSQTFSSPYGRGATAPLTARLCRWTATPSR
jgi:hypothetical protein